MEKFGSAGADNVRYFGAERANELRIVEQWRDKYDDQVLKPIKEKLEDPNLDKEIKAEVEAELLPVWRLSKKMHAVASFLTANKKYYLRDRRFVSEWVAILKFLALDPPVTDWLVPLFARLAIYKAQVEFCPVGAAWWAMLQHALLKSKGFEDPAAVQMEMSSAKVTDISGAESFVCVLKMFVAEDCSPVSGPLTLFKIL